MWCRSNRHGSPRTHHRCQRGETLGLLLTLATWALALAAAVPPSKLWRATAARAIAFGVLAFGAMVVSFQIPGVLAVATGKGLVGAPSAFVTALVLCAAVWLSPLRRAGGQDSEDEVQAPQREPLAVLRRAALPAAACLAFFGVAVSSALSAPPRGWDVLTYHLPRAVSWLQHGDLGVYGSTGAFYPGNAQILLLSILSTGSDALAPLVQLPFAALAGAAVYGLARELGARVRSAAFAAAVFLFAPMVFFQTTIAKDDIVVTSLVLAGVYFLVRAMSGGRESRRDVAVAGLALGLALGTKYSTLPFVMGSVPVAFVALALGRRGERSWKAAAASTAILTVAVLVPSAFWFVRNAVVAGNPFEPLSLRPDAWIGAAGLEQQFQFVPNLASWWIYPWLDRHIDASYSGSAGFGAAFAGLFLPGLVAAFVTRRRGRGGRYVALLAMIVMGVFAWWFGKHHLPRFLLPVAGLACAPVACLFDAARGRVRTVLVVLAVVAMAVSAAETVRIVFGEDDITWSHRSGVDRKEFYAMPDLVGELPAGTKILLLSPTEQDYHQTFRYPLVGALPGNTVVMEEDVGFELDRRSAEGIHRGLRDAGIDYVFLRTIGIKPFTTWFDDNPGSYRSIHDEIGSSYPWYRESSAYTEAGEYLGPGTAVTKIYAVLPD